MTYPSHVHQDATIYQNLYTTTIPAGLGPLSQGLRQPIDYTTPQPQIHHQSMQLQEQYEHQQCQYPLPPLQLSNYTEIPAIIHNNPSPPAYTTYHHPLPYPLSSYYVPSDDTFSSGASVVDSSLGSPAPSPPGSAVSQTGYEGERQGLKHLIDAPEGQHPGYSIKSLIEFAIKGSPTGRMSLKAIYEAIEERYPIYKAPGSTFRNSARHDISMDNRFVKMPRLPSEPGKGNMWTFDPTRPPRPTKRRVKKNKKGTAKSQSDSPPHSSPPSIIMVETPQTVEKRSRAARKAAAPYNTRTKL